MSEGVEQSVTSLSVTDTLVILAGVALFASWLLSTSLGRKALVQSKPRRNRVPWYVPILVFLGWMAGMGLLPQVALEVVGKMEQWRELFLGNIMYSVASVIVVAIVGAIAKLDFARGLKGLGLRVRTVPRDLAFAFFTLLAVQPLVLAMMSLTILVARALFGKDFTVPQHEALKLITESPALPLQILLVVVAVVVAPVVEEMLFRGLVQTTIRSYVQRPWPAIVLTSLLFASIHVNGTHWPSLFVLALGLGYSYEKSGSLLRPIFMHAMFNGFTVATVLTGPPAWLC